MMVLPLSSLQKVPLSMEMTETEFVSREITVWGFDYIESLLYDGYVPVYTDRGWKWLKDRDAGSLSSVDKPSYLVTVKRSLQ